MAYTPELSYRGSATLRRLAWFRGKPMSKTLEALMEATGKTMAEVRPGEVCARCKDNSTCEECSFQPPPKTDPPHFPASRSDHSPNTASDVMSADKTQKHVLSTINL